MRQLLLFKTYILILIHTHYFDLPELIFVFIDIFTERFVQHPGMSRSHDYSAIYFSLISSRHDSGEIYNEFLRRGGDEHQVGVDTFRFLGPQFDIQPPRLWFFIHIIAPVRLIAKANAIRI